MFTDSTSPHICDCTTSSYRVEVTSIGSSAATLVTSVSACLHCVVPDPTCATVARVVLLLSSDSSSFLGCLTRKISCCIFSNGMTSTVSCICCLLPGTKRSKSVKKFCGWLTTVIHRDYPCTCRCQLWPLQHSDCLFRVGRPVSFLWNPELLFRSMVFDSLTCLCLKRLRMYVARPFDFFTTTFDLTAFPASGDSLANSFWRSFVSFNLHCVNI